MIKKWVAGNMAIRLAGRAPEKRNVGITLTIQENQNILF
jgi:hypothetical protein